MNTTNENDNQDGAPNPPESTLEAARNTSGSNSFPGDSDSGNPAFKPAFFIGDSRVLPDFTGIHAFFLSVIASVPGNSDFANLSPEDHANPLHWIIHHRLVDVRAILAKPRPEGLSIETSINSISRYRRKYLGRYLEALQQDQCVIAGELRELSNSENLKDLKTATLALLRRRLFQMAIRDDSDPREIRALSLVFEKLADQSIARERARIAKTAVDRRHPPKEEFKPILDPTERSNRLAEIFGLNFRDQETRPAQPKNVEPAIPSQ